MPEYELEPMSGYDSTETGNVLMSKQASLQIEDGLLK
jgi:hypothetical protein